MPRTKQFAELTRDKTKKNKIDSPKKIIRGEPSERTKRLPVARVTTAVATTPTAAKRQYLHAGVYGIRKQRLRKILLKGGVLRVSQQAYKEMRDIIWSYMVAMMRDAHAVDTLNGLGHRFYGQGAL
jgi:hypothetical protein